MEGKKGMEKRDTYRENTGPGRCYVLCLLSPLSSGGSQRDGIDTR